MRIRTSDNYFHEYGCGVYECERRYCTSHRLLWRDCDTAKGGVEGDRDVINGTQVVLELGDCPECESEFQHRKFEREMEAPRARVA